MPQIQSTARTAVPFETNIVSKTSFEKFNKCALQAYLSRRKPAAFANTSEAASVGLLAHALANARVEAFMGSSAKLDQLYTQYSSELIFETMNTMSGFATLEKHFEKLEQLQSEVTYSIEMPQVADKFKLTARFDAVGIKQIGDDAFCVVIDWKSGFLVDNTIDDEALLYSYVAFKTFGLPVIFTRVALRTGYAYSEVLSPEEILAMEQVFIAKFKTYKMVLESPNEPRSTPGPHCLYCPFLETCPTKDYDPSELENRFSLLQWATQLAKAQDTFLKNAGKEALRNEDQPSASLHEGYRVLIPGTSMSVGCSTTTTYQSASRSVKKSDILQAMLDNGVFANNPAFVESLDVKFNTPEIIDTVQSLGFGLKPVTRNTVTIRSSEAEGDEE